MSEYPAAPLDRSTRMMSAAFVLVLAAFTLTVPLAEGGAAGLLLGIGFPVLVVLVVCNGPDGLVVISPEDPAAFVTAAQP